MDVILEVLVLSEHWLDALQERGVFGVGHIIKIFVHTLEIRTIYKQLYVIFKSTIFWLLGMNYFGKSTENFKLCYLLGLFQVRANMCLYLKFLFYNG